jgi:serine/threonine protein kinase
MSEPDPYTPYCDVYSFGVVIYELISGQLPYSNMHERDLVSPLWYILVLVYAQNMELLRLTISLSLKILFMVGRGFLRPEPSHARKDTPKAFKQLLVKCCDFNKDERPLFPQVSSIV